MKKLEKLISKLKHVLSRLVFQALVRKLCLCKGIIQKNIFNISINFFPSLGSFPSTIKQGPAVS